MLQGRGLVPAALRSVSRAKGMCLGTQTLLRPVLGIGDTEATCLCVKNASSWPSEGLWKAGPSSVTGTPLKLMPFFILLYDYYGVHLCMVCLCMPWCMYRGQRTALWSLISLPCLHSEHVYMFPRPPIPASLSPLKRTPQITQGSTWSRSAAAPLCTASTGPTPALHTDATAHTSPCYFAAITGHTRQGSTPHLSYEAVLLLARACSRVHTAGRAALFFFPCFVSLLVWPHGAWAE